MNLKIIFVSLILFPYRILCICIWPRGRISAFKIDGDKNGQWFNVSWDLKEFLTYLERGSMNSFKIYTKKTIFRKQIMIVISNPIGHTHNHSFTRCALFDSYKHGQMNSHGYSSHGFDFDMQSTTIADKIISVFESIVYPEYEEVVKQEFSKLDWIT